MYKKKNNKIEYIKILWQVNPYRFPIFPDSPNLNFQESTGAYIEQKTNQLVNNLSLFSTSKIFLKARPRNETEIR